MNKTFTAAAATALLLATTAGGATAATLITSKDIKNGTIKTADLAKSLRTQLDAPDAVGFTTVIRVASTPPNTTVATCPAGTTLIGGGGQSTSNSSTSASYPEGNAWHTTPTSFPENFTTYALCAS